METDPDTDVKSFGGIMFKIFSLSKSQELLEALDGDLVPCDADESKCITNNNNTQCLLDSLKSARKECNFMKDFFFRTQCEGHEENIFQKEKKKKICSLVNFHIFPLF